MKIEFGIYNDLFFLTPSIHIIAVKGITVAFSWMQFIIGIKFGG